MQKSKKSKLPENIKKVGVCYDKKEPVFSYYKVTYDQNGWADATQFLPGDYDLCLLKMHTGFIKPGWFTGGYWDGLKLNDDDKVLQWKLNKEV